METLEKQISETNPEEILLQDQPEVPGSQAVPEEVPLPEQPEEKRKREERERNQSYNKVGGYYGSHIDTLQK